MPDDDEDGTVTYVDFSPPPTRERKPRTPSVDKPATLAKKAPTPRKSSRSDLQSRTAGTYAKLLTIVTVVIMWGRIKRLQIPDPNGELAEELSFNDEEADAIAQVLARVTMSNETAKKIAKPIVDNEDVIDAVFALWDWNKRVEVALARYQRNVVQEVPQSVNPRESAASEAPSDGGVDGGFLYDANRDFSGVGGF